MTPETLAPWATTVPDAPYPISVEAFMERYCDERGYELVEGRVVRVTPTGGSHGGIDVRIIMRLGPYVEEHQLGELLAAETGFLVSATPGRESVLAPDVAFVRAEHIPTTKKEREGYWPVAPDFVAEVASPSQSARMLRQKAELWLRVGTRLVWVVWPRTETIDVYRPGEPVQTLTTVDVITGGDVFPGWNCAVRQLFP